MKLFSKKIEGSCNNYYLKTGMIFALCISFLILSVSLSAGAKLSSKGKEVFERKLAEYPSFDEDKYRSEAKKKFKLYKEGEEVTLSSSRKVLKGKFRGITAKSIKIDRKEMPRFDLTESQIAKFDPDVNAKCRERYLKGRKSGYNAQKTMFASKLRTNLLKSYPSVSKLLFFKIFKKLKDKAIIKKYSEQLYNEYNEKLPLPDGVGKKAFISQIVKEFVRKNQDDFVLLGSYVISKDELKKKQKAKELALKKKAERQKERIVFPRAGTPEFKPEGGFLGTPVPGDKVMDSFIKLEIASPTKDAEIHYTLDGSIPDESSPLYVKPIIIKKTAKIKAIALHEEYNDSDVAQCRKFDDSGLLAYFFHKINFTGQTFRKVVKNVDCDFGNDTAPFEGFVPQYFSTFFTGVLIPPKSGEYGIYISADDAVRMWVDKDLIINGWKEQSETEYKTKIKFQAGREYNIRIAFAAITGISMIKLSWKGPGIKKQVIPAKYFKRHGYETDKLEKWCKMKGGRYLYRKRMYNPGMVGGSTVIDYYFKEHREAAFKLLKQKDQKQQKKNKKK